MPKQGTNADTDPVIRVVKYQIDVTSMSPAQRELLERHAGCARQAWNWATSRWHDWQRTVRAHVARKAAATAAASTPTLSTPPTTDELGDLICETRALMRGEGHRKSWQTTAYAEARALFGTQKVFEDAYTLAQLYRLDAADPESRMHWWVAEGKERPKGTAAHGVSTFAYQSALADFAKTTKQYWARPRYSTKTGRRLGAPRIKSRRDQAGGFALMNLTTTSSSPWKIIDDNAPGHRLTFPNLGSVRMIGNVRELRRYTARGGRATSARLTQRGSRWWASINIQMPADHPSVARPPHPNRAQRAGGAVGIDLGVRSLATLSTGEQIPGRADALRAQNIVVKHLQRQIDRQHRAGSPQCFTETGQHSKGRCRWGGNHDGDPPMSRSARATKHRLHAMESLRSRQRQGVLHELTARLAKNFEHISIEDLNVSGMTARAKPKPDPDKPGAFQRNRRRAKAGLNRAVLDVGFGEFRRQLEYKSARSGATLVIVDRFAPTSKTCSRCGTVKPKLGLNERTYRCATCDLITDRDVNAAMNIRRLGLRHATRQVGDHSGNVYGEPGHPGVGAATRPDGTRADRPAEKTREDSRESTGRAIDPSPSHYVAA